MRFSQATALRSGFCDVGPGQKVDVKVRMVVDDPGDRFGEVGQWLDVVQLACCPGVRRGRLPDIEESRSGSHLGHMKTHQLRPTGTASRSRLATSIEWVMSTTRST